jgi:hypothetical protein
VSGTFKVKTVPPFGPGSTEKVPPSRVARSAMFVNPL